MTTLRKIASLGLILLATAVQAQLNELQVNYFKSREDSLKIFANEALRGEREALRKAANAHFTELLERTLHEPLSLLYPFDSLATIAKLVAPDGSFTLYNWELRNDDDSYEYYALLQRRDGKRKKTGLQVFTLVDKSQSIKKPETAALDYNNWYGAHYYKLVPLKVKRKDTYVLLGIDWNDKLTHKKLLEILFFASGGKPKFGDAIIKVGEIKGHPILQRRFFMEYSAEVTASLRYEEKRGIFIFDHLVPQQENLKGQFQFYGPDLSFDGFALKKGLLQLIEDVDARNEKNARDKNYHQPK